MCGIVSYIGTKSDAVDRILNGIEESDERGYDSIGVAFRFDDEIKVYKKAEYKDDEGKRVIPKGEEIRKEISIDKKSFCGIGHNRWATHGDISKRNAHPHWDFKNTLLVVQNGIVENYKSLKNSLSNRYNLDFEIEYRSETDTELIANIISLEYNGDLERAVVTAMEKIEGANAIVVMAVDHPDCLVATTLGAPLLVCKNDAGVMISSMVEGFKSQISHEIPAFVVVDNGEIVVAKEDGFCIKKNNKKVDKVEYLIDTDEFSTGKNGYDHYMQKEIMEQSDSLLNTIRGRFVREVGISKLGGIEDKKIADALAQAENFHFVGCGTSLNACRFAELLFSRFGIRAKAWTASEFLSSHPIVDQKDVFFLVSQSGGTHDVKQVMREVKNIKNNLCLGIVNKQETEISRETKAGVHIRAGRERGVASTKAFTSTLASIVLIAVFLARQRSMTSTIAKEIFDELSLIPELVNDVISENDEKIRILAERYAGYKNYFFSGRYLNYVVAREAALKLLEIAYIPAITFPLGELKHGPLALIEESFCSFIIAPNDSVFKEGQSGISEIVARRGPVIAVTTPDATNFVAVDDIIIVPKTIEILQPILSIIPAQLFAYYIARVLKRDIDKPRGIAKIVTTG